MRSLSKGPYIAESLLKKVEQKNQLPVNDSQRYKPIRTWSRRSVIVPKMIGFSFEIHNGKSFEKLLVQDNMLGHKLGEFAPTRKYPKHPVNKK
jgi:small subunit ribosomal protein S19